MPNSQGASKWAGNVGRQALLRFWGGRTSQAPPPPDLSREPGSSSAATASSSSSAATASGGQPNSLREAYHFV